MNKRKFYFNLRLFRYNIIKLNNKELKMVLIEDYLLSRLEEGFKNKDLADELGITPAMVGQYKLKRGYLPSLPVAKKVYLKKNIVLHPYSEESLIFEIKKDR